MAKKKNFYYVLVFTNNGPVYVTDIRWSDKTAFWKNTDKPMEFTKDVAKDLAWALCVNFNIAHMVTSCYELDHQPYRYDDYDIQFVKKEENGTE